MCMYIHMYLDTEATNVEMIFRGQSRLSTFEVAAINVLFNLNPLKCSGVI